MLAQTSAWLQVYLGGFDSEEQAALAYDLAAIKCRGEEAQTNFPLDKYAQELRHVDEARVPFCLPACLPACLLLLSVLHLQLLLARCICSCSCSCSCCCFMASSCSTRWRSRAAS